MFGRFKKKKVTLREEREPGDYRFLGAEIKDNGDLVFKGQDLGSGVEGVFGCTEYEWCWTIKKSDIPKLQGAMGGKGNIIDLLEKNFCNEKAADLYEFMQKHNIPFESWSRIGD
jgi:hypothetical protein